jgi:DNA-directed RNA polymerase subunit RPC12/RpoP
VSRNQSYRKKYHQGNQKHLEGCIMELFDYHCPECGFDFLMEEGYDNELDAIVCPNCGKEQGK